MATLDSQPALGRLLAVLDDMDLRALSRSLSEDLREREVTFGTADGRGAEAFVVDPVPRVIERELVAASEGRERARPAQPVQPTRRAA